MKKLSKSYIEIKKSKFIGLLYEINSLEEINELLNSLKKEHKKAKHIVYAYKLNNLEKNYSDKEPSGTTIGLIDLIHRKNLNNNIIIVIRYFGGILLGSGPLTRAYTKVAANLFIKQ